MTEVKKRTNLIKRLLLESLRESEGISDWRQIEPKIKAYFFAHRAKLKQEIPSSKEVTHVAYLLERDDAVERIVDMPMGIFYRLTPWGHALLDSWYKKWSYFLVHKNHNVIALVALGISIIAIILSDKVLSLLGL